MKERIPFECTIGATKDDCRALAREISPLETRTLPSAAIALLAEMFIADAAISRTYVARLGGRLAGICFVRDWPGYREMAFTKTRYLAEERKIAFALGIGRLFDTLAAFEAEAGCDGAPMYMHVPEGDEKSKNWFLKAGCRLTGCGLLCPGGRRKSETGNGKEA